MHSNESKKSIELDKKISKFLTVIILFLFGVIGGALLTKIVTNNKCKTEEKDNSNIISIYDIKPIIKEYSKLDKSTIYLYNTNDIVVTLDNKEITLKEYINNYKNVEDLFTSLEEELKLIKTLQDGGTSIYEVNKSNIFNSNYTIIKCNTEEGNKDIYFGEYVDTTKAFENGVCNKKVIKDKNFTKVYTIKKIKLIKDNNYEITILDEDTNKSVKIERVIKEGSMKLLDENKKYTFYFQNKYGELIIDDIKKIFDSATLNGVVPLEE